MKRFKTFFNLYSLQRRFLASVLIICIIFVSLLFRVFYLQMIRGEHLQVLAAEEWLRGLPLASRRGEIYDVNGVSLATTVTTYDVYVRARTVNDPSGLSEKIHDLLGVNYDTAYKKVTNTNLSEILIKLQVDEDKALALAEYKGIYLSQNVKRYYPYSNLATQVLGYTTIDNIGQAGLERYYDKYLKGVAGKSLTQTNAQGKEIANSIMYYIPSVAGADLYTTLDVQMQSILERELMTAYTEHKALGVSGLILDAKTGGIKAMTCLPSFDLNNIPRDNISDLQIMTKNSTVVDVYEPGSTFKLITLAAALNEGLTDVNERFYCGGRCVVDGEKIKCWKSTGHGSLTLMDAFKNSCNCVFVNLALRIGLDRYYQYLDYFGLGDKTGVDISSESSGIVMPKENVRTVDLARIGFGHAIAVTQLQMATIYARITTGNNITPHLIDSLHDESRVLYQHQLASSRIELKNETIAIINRMLGNNVNSDADYTFIAGYDVGGKTGTAQKYGDNGQIDTGKYISSFIGTYPASNPDMILIVCVNEPSAGAYYGGVVAKPIGERVFSSIFDIKALPPTDAAQLENKPTIRMPYVVGMSLADACAKLRELGLVALFDQEGSYVVQQLPPADTMLYIGEIVYLIVV